MPRPDPPSSILIVKPSSLGDVVHTLPAARYLRRAWPQTALRWIVNTEWAPLLAGNPDLTEVIEFPRSQFRGLRSTPALFAWLRGLSRLQPDLALDFQGLFRSAVLARASRARQIRCLSNAELLNRLSASRVVPMEPHEHAVDRYLRIITDLDLPTDDPPAFPLPPGERPVAFEVPEPYFLLHPFSRGEGKSLPPEAVRGLARRLAPARVVVAGRAGVALDLPPNALNLLNTTTLAELIWLIRHAHFTVSVDSGPMHIASALTPRLLSLHTWSDPRLVGPYNPGAWIWKSGAIFKKKDLTPSRAGGADPFHPKDLSPLVEFLRSV